MTYVDRLASTSAASTTAPRAGRDRRPHLGLIRPSGWPARLLIWNFPNAGNPQKVQRYPDEWAAALRQMAALEPELLLPAHGLPIGGAERIRRVLETVAGTLEDLVERVLALMNQGATLDEVVHEVRVPDDVLALPYLRPVYDEPEFVVRNVWRLYGGWWDGDPAHLKPPREVSWPPRWRPSPAAPIPGQRAPRSPVSDLRLACQLASGRRHPTTRTSGPCASVYEERRRPGRP